MIGMTLDSIKYAKSTVKGILDLRVRYLSDSGSDESAVFGEEGFVKQRKLSSKALQIFVIFFPIAYYLIATLMFVKWNIIRLIDGVRVLHQCGHGLLYRFRR